MADNKCEADLLFVGSKLKGKTRVDGSLKVPSKGLSFDARSGSSSLLPLPPGFYRVKNLRRRKDNIAMIVRSDAADNMCLDSGWSVDLEPLFATNRTLLRIHPDGNLPGSEGCIVAPQASDSLYRVLKSLMEGRDSLTLLVDHNGNS